jgi:hypothetical protein
MAQRRRFAGCSGNNKRGRAGANLQLAHALERREIDPVVLVERGWKRGCIPAQVYNGKSD